MQSSAECCNEAAVLSLVIDMMFSQAVTAAPGRVDGECKATGVLSCQSLGRWSHMEEATTLWVKDVGCLGVILFLKFFFFFRRIDDVIVQTPKNCNDQIWCLVFTCVDKFVVISI